MADISSALLDELQITAAAMFEKNFVGIFHGSLSLKISSNEFLINRRSALFNNLTRKSMSLLYTKEDYRWKEASIDTPIHISIYQNFSDAKCVAYCFPPFTVAYSLNHDSLTPHDYFGSRLYKNMPVYDPRDFESWYERAEVEIYRFLKERKSHVMVIRGYGVYLYGRSLSELAKNIAILENSCRILYLYGLENKSDLILSRAQSDLMLGDSGIKL
ncbi:MAG: class II aldolase and adducin N-terminal domain-containing protein [Helicobacter sp.]|nr:class II aldolase and adducin N-terminal domain-containing protein [Helicobacter sp.]